MPTKYRKMTDEDKHALYTMNPDEYDAFGRKRKRKKKGLKDKSGYMNAQKQLQELQDTGDF